MQRPKQAAVNIVVVGLTKSKCCYWNIEVTVSQLVALQKTNETKVTGISECGNSKGHVIPKTLLTASTSAYNVNN
jgi:hypothetical protein